MMAPLVAHAGPPVVGRLADHASKDGREVRMRPEATTERDVEHAERRRAQQHLRMLDPAPQHERVRRIAGRRAELRGEMHAGEPGAGGDIGKSYRLREIRFDEVERAPQTPLRQR